MYGHSIKTKAKRNNVSGQKQRQQNRNIVSQRTLEEGFEVWKKLKKVFGQAGYRSAEIQNGYFR